MMSNAAHLVTVGWRWFSGLCAAAAIALAIGYGVVKFFAVTGPVVVAIGPPRDITTRVPPGGVLAFTIEFERFASCPGTVIETFSNLEERNVVVVGRRPTLAFHPRRYPPTRVNVQLSSAITAGKWRYTQTVESRCPEGMHTDSFVEFEFEVA